MGGLTRDQILASTALSSEVVEVPEWGGQVTVREMTVAEQEHYGELMKGPDGKIDLADYRPKLLRCTVCDATGALLFRDEDLEALGHLSAAVTDRVWEVAARLNNLRPGELEALGKELASPREGSSSVSPPSSDEPSPKSSEG